MIPIATLSFSLIAVLLVCFASRRDSFRAARVTAVAIVLLLAFPLLTQLPKLDVLPVSSSSSSAEGNGFPWQWLWVAGTVLLLLRILTSAIRLAAWRRNSELLETIPLARRKVELRCHDAIDSPMAAGILKPLVLVPSSWPDWEQADRSMVLAHELAHHRRHDPLWRLLGAMACALHWFNPLVWWLVRRHAILSEFACDAMVIRNGVRPESYAHLLCDLAQSQPAPQSTAAMSESSSLKARVTRLMSPGNSISPAFSAILTSIIIVAAVVTAVVRRAETEPAKVPVEEVKLRLSADPFPGNR